MMDPVPNWNIILEASLEDKFYLDSLRKIILFKKLILWKGQSPKPKRES